MSDRDLVTEGRALLAAATPPPWWIGPSGDIFAGEGSGDVQMVAEDPGSRDARLLAWAVSNLPTLLDQLEAAHTALDIVRDIARGNSHALDEARTELQQLHNETQEAFTAIAVKQKRDTERIAELEKSQPVAGYIVLVKSSESGVVEYSSASARLHDRGSVADALEHAKASMAADPGKFRSTTKPVIGEVREVNNNG